MEARSDILTAGGGGGAGRGSAEPEEKGVKGVGVSKAPPPQKAPKPASPTVWGTQPRCPHTVVKAFGATNLGGRREKDTKNHAPTTTLHRWAPRLKAVSVKGQTPSLYQICLLAIPVEIQLLCCDCALVGK